MKKIDITQVESDADICIATSEWLQIDQEMINQFAEVTDDKQWIHIDIERAMNTPEFGSTIAHGYLVLSLIPHFAQTTYEFTGVVRKMNYGLDSVRFLTPVKSDARIRAQFFLQDKSLRSEHTYKIKMKVVIEVEDSVKPACIAETISLLTKS